MDALLLPMPGNEAMARCLAPPLEIDTGDLVLRRFPDGETHVRFGCDPAGRSVILVSTLDHGMHAVLASDAEAALREAGAADVVACNTIAHHTNRIDVCDEIAKAIRGYLSNGAGP